jgi:hypothetical protein
MLAINEYKTAGSLDRVKDRFGIGTAGLNIPGRDPTGDTALFERGNDGIGCGRILVGMTDENVLAAHSLRRCGGFVACVAPQQQEARGPSVPWQPA